MLSRLKLLALICAVAAAAAFQALPGSAAKPAAAPCSVPTMSGTNDAGDGSTVIPVGQEYTVWGCGFAPGAAIKLEVAEHGVCCEMYDVVADSAGRYTYSGVTEWGAYRFRAYTQQRNKRWAMAAEWWFGSY